MSRTIQLAEGITATVADNVSAATIAALTELATRARALANQFQCLPASATLREVQQPDDGAAGHSRMTPRCEYPGCHDTASRNPIGQAVAGRRERYVAYLAGDHWRHLRERLFKLHGYQCKACDALGIEIGIDGHHLVYRDRIEDGTVDDLMPLCRRCHDIAHTMPKLDPRLNVAQRFAKTREFIRRLLGLKDVKKNWDNMSKLERKTFKAQKNWARQIQSIRRAKLRRLRDL